MRILFKILLFKLINSCNSSDELKDNDILSGNWYHYSKDVEPERSPYTFKENGEGSSRWETETENQATNFGFRFVENLNDSIITIEVLDEDMKVDEMYDYLNFKLIDNNTLNLLNWEVKFYRIN